MAAPRRRRSLRWKLFLSYVAVLVVGSVTLLVAVNLLAPTLFGGHFVRLLGPGWHLRPWGPWWRFPGQLPPNVNPEDPFSGIPGIAFGLALRQALLLAGLVGAVTAVVASLLVSSRVVGPIRQMVAASRRLAEGHYAERVPAAGDDELGELATSFNELAAALEATERRRQELIGDVAHELRTPVATLEGYLEGLLDGVVEPGPPTWAKLHDEAGRLRRLVDDLQELSRAEARQLSLRSGPLDPADVVHAATERLAPQFAEKGLDLACELPARLPPVQADPDRAVQVLTNLLSNALRYTPAPGTVRVGARALEDAVEFCVGDTGMGIAAEHLPHLFERFYRVDRSRSRALGGSGVGLTIARALVEAMGGRIWAESPGPGQGATFGFTLPRRLTA